MIIFYKLDLLFGMFHKYIIINVLFQCSEPNCGRRFTTIYNLSSHQKLHLRPAQMVCPVESCGASFQTKRSLELHMKTHDVLHAPYKYVI